MQNADLSSRICRKQLFKPSKLCYNIYMHMIKCETMHSPSYEKGAPPAMFEPKLKSEQTDLLMKAVLRLTSVEDAYRFFEDICTIAEVKSMAQRLEVAVLLRDHVTYQEIARQTGASSATISRVNRALTYGADGYNRVLDAMQEQGELPE